ncbi:Hypothetical protein SRAE_1000327400 [Strongyloides ratti]|uniref:Uncharacterized protein n=1 Tax=Strongyloides ratti TaxID=34506 RepID=A0A090L5D9_STRRB|nr:Hypothetical protein SRAE_1000327400 [Strongyloides ratti]CEF65021.1 Hypothetical protein SRAE_1000327400 [Strongyloides ratti]
MWLIFFFAISTIFANKVIWNGDNYDFDVTTSAKLIPGENVIGSGSVNKKNSKLTQVIDIFPHMTMKNVRILNLNINKYKSGNAGFKITIDKNHKNNQMFGQGHASDDYFIKISYSTCQLLHCEGGIYLLHKKPSTNFIAKNITNFYGAFYLKFISNDMFFLLDEFNIYDNEFPLITCPYIKWTSLYSGTKFVPLENSGIIFKKFQERQILVPGYQRNKYSNIFICGYLIYIDNSKLTIGHKITYHQQSDLKIKTFDNPKDIWICNSNDSPSKYFHFAFSKNIKGNNKMRYIKYDLLKENNLYYDDVIYLYDKNNEVIKELKEYGVIDFKGMKIVKPKCANKLSPRKGIVKIVNENKIKVSNTNNDIEIMYVNEDMLNNITSYKCKIIIDGVKENPYLSNFYEHETELLLVSKDIFENKIIHKNIVFKNNFNGFEKYSCDINVKNKFFNDISYIKNLTFVTIPINSSVSMKKEFWNTKDDILIQCPIKITTIGTFYSMIVIVSENLLYKKTLNDNSKMFYNEDNFIRFRHLDLLVKDISLQNVTTKCIYKTYKNMTFSITKNGKILNFIFYQFTNNTNYLFFIMLVLGILIVIFIIFVIIIIIIKKKKPIKESKNTFEKLSLTSSLSTVN